MVPDRVRAIVLRQFYLMRGSFTRILPMFIWVAVDMILWGYITRYLNSVTGHTDFVPSMLGAVLLWDFLVRVMQGTTMSFMEDTWSRNFLNLFATPITIGEYITGLVISSIATSLIGLAVMLVLATTVFGLSFFAYGILLLPFLLVLFMFGIALGIVGCTIMLRLGPAAEWFIWPIPAVLSPFACVFYPMSTLPGWMQAVSQFLPPTHVFEGIRAIASGHAASIPALAWGAGLALAYIALASYGFSRVFRYVVKSGLIARYSAESVS